MTHPPAPDLPAFDRKLLIEGLGKGLRVIEAFTDDRPRMTATEAGLAADLTRTLRGLRFLQVGRLQFEQCAQSLFQFRRGVRRLPLETLR